MKNLLRAAFVMCWVVLSGVGAADEPAAETTITVDALAQARLGVTVAILKGAPAPAVGIESTASVLDSVPLVKLAGELASASAGFAASLADTQRARKSYAEDRTKAAGQAVRAALSQEQADLQRVQDAHRQLALEWGGGVANLQAHRRAELLTDLSSGHVELLRVEVPAGVAAPGPGASIVIHGNAAGEVFAGSVLGLLPVAQPGVQTRGLLVELKANQVKLPIGPTLSATVPTSDASAPIAGVVLPRTALLQRGSHVWVYVQTSPTGFVRREVRDSHSVPDGWFVGKGFTAGERVVTGGAAALLGVESPGAADGG